MKFRLSQVVALLLTILFAVPAPQVMAFSQQEPTNPPQEKAPSESPEAKKLREAQEKQVKKEEERKKKEEKARSNEAKKYLTLTEFAADLYASDVEFRDQVDDDYLELQREHATEAYFINISRQKELLLTENEGEVLKIRRALYDNPRVQEYINRLGQQIVPDDSEKLYAFKVIVNPIPQAYTLSTGTVLVSTGMLAQLDNEAQLAYVLAHELAHVYKDHWRIKVMMPLAEEEYNKKQERKRRRWAAIAALAGAGIGAAVADSTGAIAGFGAGLGAGYVVSSYYSRNINLDWNVAQENEADDFALQATLRRSFDIQQVPLLYSRLAQVAKADNRTALGFLGARARIRERSDYAQKMIAGPLQTSYQEALKTNNLKGMSPEFNLIMAELKRDNGIHAFYFDMLYMAKQNLQQSVMLRSDDPLAAYYYGRVLKLVGRTREDLDTADHALLKAISLDVRRDIPEVQLHRALMLMDSKGNTNNTEAIAALQAYIVDYGRKRITSRRVSETLPPNIDVLYGYMRLLGEKTWTAPNPAELQRSVQGDASSFGAQPVSAPRVESPPQTAPTKAKQTRKP